MSSVVTTFSEQLTQYYSWYLQAREYPLQIIANLKPQIKDDGGFLFKEGTQYANAPIFL